MNKDQKAILRKDWQDQGPVYALFQTLETDAVALALRVAQAPLASDEDVLTARALQSKYQGFLHALDSAKALINDED